MIFARADFVNVYRMHSVWLERLVWSVSPIAAENQLGNASKRDPANNCYRANPLPTGWAKRQESKSVSERSNSAKNEKRPGEEAMNAAAAGSVNQAHYTHERERRCPQNRFQDRRRPKSEREGKPWYTPKKTRAQPPAQEVALRTARVRIRRLHGVKSNLPLFEIARVLVRFDHVARFIVNANHGIVRAEAVRVPRMVRHFSVPLR
jgi:hypothetical protein